MLSAAFFPLASSAMLAAGLVQGMTGFGFALVAVPILLIFLDPPSAIGLTMLMALLVAAFVCARHWRHVRLVETSLMLGASVPGILLGTQALTVWPAPTIKTLAGAAAVASALPLLLGYRRRFGRERLAAVAAGALSGFLQGSTGLSGPPIVLLMSNQGWHPEVFRASLSFFFTLASALTVAALRVNGVLTDELLLSSTSLLPALVGGMFLGIWLAGRVDVQRFRLVVNLLILATGTATLISGLAASATRIS